MTKVPLSIQIYEGVFNQSLLWPKAQKKKRNKRSISQTFTEIKKNLSLKWIAIPTSSPCRIDHATLKRCQLEKIKVNFLS